VLPRVSVLLFFGDARLVLIWARREKTRAPIFLPWNGQPFGSERAGSGFASGRASFGHGHDLTAITPSIHRSYGRVGRVFGARLYNLGETG
jgi:diadenosine tetraphosphatase ApaH/serine/threonine PP2A family protein phosphatase